MGRDSKSFSNADVYYLSGYVKAFKIHGDGEPILYYYQDENIRAINVVMKRDIAEDKKFSESIPMIIFLIFQHLMDMVDLLLKVNQILVV